MAGGSAVQKETQMIVDPMKTVREVALSIPGATRVFERFGIDYCCGGSKPLTEASNDAQVRIDEIIDFLESAAIGERERASTVAGQQGENWQEATLRDLSAHIINTHHRFVKTEISRLRPLFDKVSNVHGPRHPELLELRSNFHALTQGLKTQMLNEEMELFPYIGRMEEAVIGGEPILPAPFGSLDKRIAAMVDEHHAAGRRLRRMHESSSGYRAPAGACTSYKTLYCALAGFERDLRQHVHLENNILFPRAIQMEQEKRCDH